MPTKAIRLTSQKAKMCHLPSSPHPLPPALAPKPTFSHALMAALKATASARKRLTFEMFHPGKTNPGRYQNHVKHGINRCKKPCEEWDEKNKPCEEWDRLSILPTGGSIPSVHILGFIHVPG